MSTEHLFNALRLLSRAFAREQNKFRQTFSSHRNRRGGLGILIITIPSVNKKPGEETPIRLRRTRPAEKIMMIIFSDKYDILLDGTTISGPYFMHRSSSNCTASF